MSFRDFEDEFLTDEALDAECGDEQGDFPTRLPTSDFMECVFGPVKPSLSNPPLERGGDQEFSVEVDGY